MPNPDAGLPKGPFREFPSKDVIEHFRAHVLKTGEPDTWKHHSASVPPPGEDFVEVIKFDVPHSLRGQVERASCPICSPSSPKYYEGVLAWFPAEGLLRAIGNECAKSHFGDERVARSKLKGQRDRAVDFLLERLPEAVDLKRRVERFRSVASAMDDVREAVFRASSRAAWQRIAKAGADGYLYIERIRAVDAVDSFGRTYQREVAEPVGQFQIDGLSFMRGGSSSLMAAAAIGAVELVATCDEAELVDFVSELEGRQQDLLDAERVLRAAIEAVVHVEASIAAARAFLAPANLKRLDRWTHNDLVEVGVVLSHSDSSPHQFRLRAPPSSQWQTLTIPADLRSA